MPLETPSQETNSSPVDIQKTVPPSPALLASTALEQTINIDYTGMTPGQLNKRILELWSTPAFPPGPGRRRP